MEGKDSCSPNRLDKPSESVENESESSGTEGLYTEHIITVQEDHMGWTSTSSSDQDICPRDGSNKHFLLFERVSVNKSDAFFSEHLVSGADSDVINEQIPEIQQTSSSLPDPSHTDEHEKSPSSAQHEVNCMERVEKSDPIEDNESVVDSFQHGAKLSHGTCEDSGAADSECSIGSAQTVVFVHDKSTCASSSNTKVSEVVPHDNENTITAETSHQKNFKDIDDLPPNGMDKSADDDEVSSSCSSIQTIVSVHMSVDDENLTSLGTSEVSEETDWDTNSHLAASSNGQSDGQMDDGSDTSIHQHDDYVLLDWENNELFDEATRNEMQAMWELPQVGQFLNLTQNILNLKPLSQFEIERMLLMPEASRAMAAVMTALLCSSKVRQNLQNVPPMPYKIWMKRLSRRVNQWYSTLNRLNRNYCKAFDKIGVESEFWLVMGEQNPLKHNGFLQLSYRQRVCLVKALCDNFFCRNLTKVAEGMSSCPSSQLREKVLGKDRNGNVYFHLPRCEKNELRIYRKSAEEDLCVEKLETTKIKGSCKVQQQKRKIPKKFKEIEPPVKMTRSRVRLLDVLSERNVVANVKPSAESSDSEQNPSLVESCSTRLRSKTHLKLRKLDSEKQETEGLPLKRVKVEPGEEKSFKDDQRAPNNTSFELVAVSLDDLRTLVVMFSEGDADKQSWRCTVEEKCERVLARNLKGLLVSLAPHEQSFRARCRKLRNRMYTEWHQFQSRSPTEDDEAEKFWNLQASVRKGYKEEYFFEDNKVEGSAMNGSEDNETETTGHHMFHSRRAKRKLTFVCDNSSSEGEDDDFAENLETDVIRPEESTAKAKGRKGVELKKELETDSVCSPGASMVKPIKEEVASDGDFQVLPCSFKSTDPHDPDNTNMYVESNDTCASSGKDITVNSVDCGPQVVESVSCDFSHAYPCTSREHESHVKSESQNFEYTVLHNTSSSDSEQDVQIVYENVREIPESSLIPIVRKREKQPVNICPKRRLKYKIISEGEFCTVVIVWNPNKDRDPSFRASNSEVLKVNENKEVLAEPIPVNACNICNDRSCASLHFRVEHLLHDQDAVSVMKASDLRGFTRILITYMEATNQCGDKPIILVPVVQGENLVFIKLEQEDSDETIALLQRENVLRQNFREI